MGRTHLNTIVPTRFLTTIGHLIVVLMINYTYEANIRASLRINYSQAEWDSAETSIQWYARGGGGVTGDGCVL
jgi:hypothetical protein